MTENLSTPGIEKLECPFCKARALKVFHKEATFSTQRTRCRFGRSTSYVRSPERYEVLVGKCSNCGKNKKEIETALKEGKQPTNEEIIRRMKEAGLDPSRLR